VITQKPALLQILNLSGTSLATEDLFKFAELLKKGDYRYL
jgi:Ran GTPase-activating protein (RanGAP) involved in mRNA processing and transport